MNKIVKFELDDKKSIHDYFEKFGYVVIKDVINTNKIDAFIESYKSIRNHPLFVYYSQSTHVCTRPKLNVHGFIQESMQNASRLTFFKKFSKSFQSCIYDKNVSAALTAISGENEHVSWQNMFFDKSTGTIEHQDSWYLDTEPAGNLIGAWYALEDIHIDSGAFFVFPESHHKIGLLDRDFHQEHDSFVTAVNEQIKNLKITKKSMTLCKGDILLWHPYLIHGADICINDKLSRKSFTSHFYPIKYNAKNVEKDKLLSIYDHEKPKVTENPNIYAAYRYSDYIYNILVYGLYFKNKLLSIKKGLSMRREDYK
jgi:phytanoyl-CoA hydroxylase